MILRRLLVIFLLAAGSVACGPRLRTSEGPPPTPEAVRMLELVNEARASPRDCGGTSVLSPVPPLRLEPRLTVAAQRHSEDMRSSNLFGHVGSDGSTVRERVQRLGYAWSSVGENVAFGYESVEEVVAGWLGSPGHCRNIMHGAFSELGVGRVDAFWTQVFGGPRR